MRRFAGIIRRRLGAGAGTQFEAFALFYMVAFLLDATEGWEPPVPALLFLAGLVVVFLRGVSRASFVAFLLASSAYVRAVQFPDPGNHNNIFLFCNVLLLAGVVYAARRPDSVPDDEALFELLKSPLRVTLSVVYVMAGFHKLNSGFFDEQAGCAQTFFGTIWEVGPFPAPALGGLALVGFGASVILWELGGGLALLFRRTQPLMLVAAWIGHGVLALIVF